MSTAATATFTKGQEVYYPLALHGRAQVDEVQPAYVSIVYRTKTIGKLARRRVRAERLARINAAYPPLFPLEHNPLGRGIVPPPPSRTYTFPQPGEVE